MKVSTTRARHALGIALGLVFGFVITSPVGVAALGMLPIISVLTPSQNQTVTGAVNFYAAADTSGVVSLQFRVDGTNFGSPITSGSCRANWDSTQTNDGLHTIEAVAQDQYGNTVMSQPVTVSVNNAVFNPTPTPTPTPAPTPAPAPGAASIAFVSPAPNQTVAGAFEAIVQMGGPVTAASLSLEVRTPSGVSMMTVSQFQAKSNGNAEKGVNMSNLVNGQYDLVAVSTVGPTSSAPVRVTLTGGLASGPTPTPTPTPAPTPAPPAPTPTPTPGPAPAPGLPSPTPTPAPAPKLPAPTPTPEPTPAPTLPGNGSRTAPVSGSNKGKPKSRSLTMFGSDANTGDPTATSSTDQTIPQVQTTGQAVLRATTSTGSTASTTPSAGGGTSSVPSTSTTTSGTVGVILGTIPGGCAGPDPFKKIGGVGLCVNGEWLALWKPKKK